MALENPSIGRSPAELGLRQAMVLMAIVEMYIATGNPVPSQAIARQQNREGMSPATIRNVMAELSEAGYLEQPHTSAGRVPTAWAYRYYAEQLLRQNMWTQPVLPLPAQEQIEESLAGVVNVTDFFARTSHLLATLSGGVGVALTGTGENELLEHVHFVRLGAARVLTVLVTTTGRVRDRVLTLKQDVTARELEMAAKYLNANFYGWTLDRIRQELGRRMEQERSEYQRVLRSVQELWAKGAMDGAGSAQERDRDISGEFPANSLFVDGMANLMGNEVNRQHLQQILRALEEKQRVVDLLNAYIDNHRTSVRVIVGLEEAMPEMRDLALVAAPARRGEEHLGTVAVIGPTRMQYASTIGTVTYMAGLFERWAAHS